MDTNLGESSNGCNRKRVNLTILQKVEILKELDKGSSVKYVSKVFGISCRSVYDIRNNKEKLLQFYAKTDSNKGIFNRKRMREANSADLDAVLFEWFKQKRSENVPITGPILCQKAREMHTEMNIEESCEYTTGWLTKFKNRHGIRYLKTTGEKVSADKIAADEYLKEFQKIVRENSLSPEQIYNMDETGLYWCNLPRKTFVGQEEKEPSGVKDDKRRLTVVLCSNAAGTHKCQLFVIGKSVHPRCLKGVKVLPVTYRGNKTAWITHELCTEWFRYFLQEVQEHYCKVGLPKEAKILLLMDNCTAHPQLVAPNVIQAFLPPNTTSLLQPMDQGVINSLKCYYKSSFIRKLLNFNSTDSKQIGDFKKEFTIKDCMYLLRESWNSVTQETLVNAWHKLWPQTLFLSTENSNEKEFTGFKPSLIKIKAAELMDYAKSQMANLNEEAILEFLDKDDEPETVNHMTDAEIISSVLNPEENNSETDSEIEDEEEKISVSEGIFLGERYMKFLEKQKCVSDQELLTFHRVLEKLKVEKGKVLKQVTLDKLFKKQ